MAANLHYLPGLRLDSVQAGLRPDTDLQGLVIPEPESRPLTVAGRREGRHGLAVRDTEDARGAFAALVSAVPRKYRVMLTDEMVRELVEEFMAGSSIRPALRSEKA